jgi:hypothetical protein
VTGKSTAKITAQDNVIRKIRSLAADYGINCDIETKSAYAYTRDPSYVSMIEKEVEVAQRLGLPFDVRAAIRLRTRPSFSRSIPTAPILASRRR